MANDTTATVKDLWDNYEPITKRDNDSSKSDTGRAKHLLRHLGNRRASRLTLGEVDEYRTRRSAETTQHGGAPSPATLDRELELLKRFLNYAVACGRLNENPIAKVKLLRVPNVRRVVLDEEGFQRLSNASDAWLRPILLVAYDGGGPVLGTPHPGRVQALQHRRGAGSQGRRRSPEPGPPDWDRNGTS